MHAHTDLLLQFLGTVAKQPWLRRPPGVLKLVVLYTSATGALEELCACCCIESTQKWCRRLLTLLFAHRSTSAPRPDSARVS